MFLLFTVMLPLGTNANVPVDVIVTPVPTILLVLTLPPVTFPVALTWPVVVTLPPDTLPVAATCPPVTKLPPVTFPVKLD